MPPRFTHQGRLQKSRPLRHTRRTPCPVCGGGHNDRRKRGIRCFGYTSADGRFAFCTLEEYAGKLSLDPRSHNYRHQLDAPCSCGEPHASGSNAAALALGAGEIRYSDQQVKEHARGAIQTLSDGVPERRVFTHTGWQQMDGEWRYLHATGAQGAQNAREDVTAQLPQDLMRYQLPCLSAPARDHTEDDAISAAFCEFARELGVLSEAETLTFMARVGYALLHFGGQQLALQHQGEPTARFLALLSAALSSGEAHIATLSGAKPDAAESLWGWRLQRYGAEDTAREEWVPQGKRIGWLGGERLYLNPEAAYAVAQRLGQQTNGPLTVTQRTLWKRLHERRLLVSYDSARETLKIRVTIEGRRISVIHLRASTLTGFVHGDNPTNPTNPTNPHGMA